LILFLEPDVPWIQDGTRHHGEEGVRQSNNLLLKKLFHSYHIPFISIGGTFENRFERSIEKVNTLI
jgi:HTH-type transcriptional repressor of NAD biosynthesis genes